MRNARHRGENAYLSQLACYFAEFNALLLGLVHRTLYSTGPKMLSESMALPDRPAGHDTLCQLVMRGELSNVEQIAMTVEDAWAGIGPWAERQQLDVTHTTSASCTLLSSYSIAFNATAGSSANTASTPNRK